MASAVAALKEASLLVALCVMLLHSSMSPSPSASASPYTGQPPPPPGCHYTGQQPPPPPPPTPVVPAPTPTPTPVPAAAPMPTPTLTPPAPAPTTNNNMPECDLQCGPSCKASFVPRNCSSILYAAYNGCYGSCMNRTCAGDESCARSSCAAGCSCDNPNATTCCKACGNAVPAGPGSEYYFCQSFNERYPGNCLTACYNNCSKNRAQAPVPAPPPPPTPMPVVLAPTPTPVPAAAPMATPTVPPPAPAPISCTNMTECVLQCGPFCQASFVPQNCSSLVEGAYNGCYGSCINHTCAGDESCAHSSCAAGCSCDNPNATTCCKGCANAVPMGPGSAYYSCKSFNERYPGNCMMTCSNNCSKNCTQAPVPAPPPPPTPTTTTPTPTPPPVPAPSPAAVSNCSYSSDCASQCDQSCRASSDAGIAKCEHSDRTGPFSACFEDCTNQTCPGKSCVHSGCGFGDCSSCHNPDASTCCESCTNAVGSGDDAQYNLCKRNWEKSATYCAMGCKDSCPKNCTQGA